MTERESLVQKYNATKLADTTIGMRIAREFKDGDIANLGKGLPILAGDYIDPSIDVFYHGEPGILGYGPALGLDEWEDIDPTVIDANIRHVREKPGMAIFDMGESFNMLRGKHIDTSVVGGFEVSERGDLANWAFEYPVKNPGISIGGGFDIVVGPKRCIVAITHLDKYGKSKIVKKLHYPLTGASGYVDLIITDLAVFEVRGPKGAKEGLVLLEVAPGWSPEELRLVTEGRFEVSPDLEEYHL